MDTQNLDTHIDGAGLSPSTKTWSNWERTRKKYFTYYGDTYDLPPRKDLTGKWAIVSGANSGIGSECVKHLASWGCNVILACRDPPPHEPHPEQIIKEIREKLKESSISSSNQSEPELEFWKVDFSSFSSIKNFSKNWIKSSRTLDFLFNNAGLGYADGSNSKVTEDGFEIIHQVNYLSHCLLTLLILPTMKNSKSPRIVNTASCFHSGGILDFSNFNDEKKLGTGNAYCDSKLLLVIFTKEIQIRMSRSEDYKHVVVNAIHPGFVSSNIWNAPSIRSAPKQILFIIDSLLKIGSITTHQGSIAMLNSAFNDTLNFSEEEISKGLKKGESLEKGGKYFNRITEEDPRPEVEDGLVRNRLWKRMLEDLKIDGEWLK